ncbi:MAG: transcriptional repressor [Caldisericota bacterium]|nr:transcriptional repressor [Caldisericota bacterium]
MKKERRFRSTQPREVVLSVLESSNDHLTAEQIFDTARKIYPGIGFASVYRILKLFEEQGIVETLNVGWGKRCFQLKRQMHPARIHLIHTDCNEIVDFSNQDKEFNKTIEKFKETLKEKYGFNTSVLDIKVFGKYDKQQKGGENMPLGDGTGPLGKGPMTGRRGGGAGRGRGRGAGRGRTGGIGRGISPVNPPVQNNIGSPLNVENKEVVNAIYEILPKTDCGKCGYPTCQDCAHAIAMWEAPYDACKMLKPEQQERIKEISQKRR